MFPYIWQMVRYKPGLYINDLIVWLLIHLMPAILGVLAGRFFDALTGQNLINLNGPSILLIIGVVTLIRIILVWQGAIIDVLHRSYMSGLLRHNLLYHLLQSPTKDAISAGETISIFRDDVQQAEDSISFLFDLIGNAVFAIVASLVLLSIDRTITLVTILPLLAVSIVAYFARTRLERLRTESRKATSEVSGAIGEILSAVQAIRIAQAEVPTLAFLRSLTDRRRQLMVKDRLLGQALNSVFSSISTVGTGIVLLLAANLFRIQEFTLGEFAIFVYYLSFITSFTHFFGGFLSQLKQTGVSFNRMAQVMPDDRENALVEHKPLYLDSPIPPSIPPESISLQVEPLRLFEVRNLSLRYPSGRGLFGINLKVMPNSLTIVTGRMGSGKTTLIRAILGLLPKDEGQIYWNGILVQNSNEFFVPPRCAYTPQVPKLLSGTMRDNILLGLPDNQAALHDAAYLAVLDSDVELMAEKFDTQVGPRGVRLSGGQIQRLATARMYVRQPELLFLDEPSSALDIETEWTLWERYTNNKSTCLAVSHHQAALEAADHIVLLREGRIVDEGKLEELLIRSDEMQSLWYQTKI